MSINTVIADALFSVPHIFATKFEEEFKGLPYVTFAGNTYMLMVGFVVAYLLFISVGSYVMKDKTRFDLRLPLGYWNAALCLFSFIGMCRTAPFLAGTIMSEPFEDTVCTDPNTTWGNGPTGLWVMLFIFSKVPELVDTVFIVLRKRPLIFLHWYHHVTVLMFCWNAYATMAASGLWFVAMNYSVHALMYGYYSLSAFGVCPKSFNPFLITFSQIAQMFIGTGICISAWYYTLYTDKSCHNENSNLIAGGLMYGSYLYLFMDFAVRRYIFKSSPTTSKKTSSADAKSVSFSEKTKKLN